MNIELKILTLLPAVLVSAATFSIYVAKNEQLFTRRFKKVREELENEALAREALFTTSNTSKNTEFKLYRLGFNIGYRHFLLLNIIVGLILATVCVNLLKNPTMGALSAALWMIFIHKLVDMTYIKKVKEKMAEAAELALQLLSEVHLISDTLFDAIVEVAPSARAPLREELELLIKNYRLNKPLNECLIEFADRTDNKDIEMFVQGIILSSYYGTDTHLVLKQAAEVIRERRELKEELQNETKGKTFTVNLFLLALPVLVIFLSVKSPEARHTFITTTRGHNLLSITLLVEFFAWYFTQRREVTDQL